MVLPTMFEIMNISTPIYHHYNLAWTHRSIYRYIVTLLLAISSAYRAADAPPAHPSRLQECGTCAAVSIRCFGCSSRAVQQRCQPVDGISLLRWGLVKYVMRPTATLPCGDRSPSCPMEAPKFPAHWAL